MKKLIILLTISLIMTGCSNSEKLDIPNNISTTTVPAMPANSYTIRDLRKNNTNLIGKYVIYDKPEVSFEIKKDYAFLYYTIEEYTGYNNEQNAYIISRILEIEEEDNLTWLYFNFEVKEGKKDYNYLVRFYSENNDEFILEVFSGEHDENLIKYVFKKQAL